MGAGNSGGGSRGSMGGMEGQEPLPKPGQHPSGAKSSFVICEICDGYIKDLDQLRSHMQMIHKVKVGGLERGFLDYSLTNPFVPSRSIRR